MYRGRIVGLIIVFLLCGLILLSRLFQLQIVEGEAWALESLFLRTEKTSQPFRRGTIFDRWGTILAKDEDSYAVEFSYRNFRRNHPLGQATHFFNVVEGKPVAILDLASRPRAWARRLVSMDTSRISGLPTGKARKDARFYLYRLLELPRAAQSRLRKATEEKQAGLTLSALTGREEAWVWEKLTTSIQELQVFAGRLDLDPGDLLDFLDSRKNLIDENVQTRLSKLKVTPYQKARREKDLRVDFESRPRRLQEEIAYEAAMYLTLHEGSFPGFRIVREMKRVYPVETAASMVGIVQRPSDKQLQRAAAEDRERMALARKLRRTPEEQERFEYLLARRGASYRATEQMGRWGMEAAFETELRGRRGWSVLARDQGYAWLEGQAAEDGRDLVLTLSAELQQEAEAALREGYGEKRDLVGAMVFLDVHTGEILAMAGHPNFDRTEYRQEYKSLVEDSRQPLFHRAYNPPRPPDPGSVFKVQVAYAALEAGLITRHTSFACDGVYKKLKCNSLYHGTLDLTGAIKHSCNVYFYRVGEILGMDAMFDLSKRFGFGEKTGLEIKEIPAKLNYRARDRRKFGIGQMALTVTPLQVARSYAALANGGRLVRPHLAKWIGEEEVAPEGPDIKLDPALLKILARGMHEVVKEKGTARPRDGWDLREVGAIGKTGTAEISKKRKDHAWFAGYLPHSNPRVSFAVYIEEIGKHGGDLAAPLAYRVLKSEAMQRILEVKR